MRKKGKTPTLNEKKLMAAAGLNCNNWLVQKKDYESIYAMSRLGESVYFRYNPDDLNTVRIYDENDIFLCEGKLRNQLSYHASKDEIAAHQKENRAAAKAVKGYKKQKDIQTDTELELMLWQAEQNAGINYELNPQVVVPIRYQEPAQEDMLLAAGGGEAEVVDWTEGLARLSAEHEKNKNAGKRNE